MDQALGTYRLPGFSIIYGLENTNLVLLMARSFWALMRFFLKLL